MIFQWTMNVIVLKIIMMYLKNAGDIKMKSIIALIILAALILFGFYTITDRICDKPWSDEFKQTEDYKAMQCEQ